MERTMFRQLSRLILAASCLAISAPTWAQRGGGQPQGPPPNASTDPLLRGFEFRSIGPATMMGRVDDIQGSEKDPMTVYLGFAARGLWKSIEGGNQRKSLFDNMATAAGGSIAGPPSVANIVYVGTGEANNRHWS